MGQMMMNMIEDILNISMTRSEKAVLFITTHGTVKLNKTRDLPFTKAPIKILQIAISEGLSSSNEYLIIKKDDPQIEDVTRASKKFLKLTGFEA